MSGAEFRKPVSGDAMRISELVQMTIRSSNAADYSQTSIDSYVAIFTPDKVAERIETEDMLVGLVDGELAGVAGQRDEFIRSLFVAPKFQGKGLGRQLVARIEEIALEKGTSMLSVRSSITAEEFYASLGYTSIQRETYPEGDIILMQKSLEPAG